ncbi:hypothetical protein B0H34DRAFT_790566 [Crassisporium funariophilum]|nr:hypothetical protein B0H34DRAFT_790566 [Crassisporium funariophilum]
MFSKALIILTISTAAFAKVFTTAPVAATKYSGGKEATISWQDDGTAPSLKDFGPARISIYAGNAQQQTSLQTIEASLDVSTTSTLTFTPDASIGPNSSEYFIRFESLALKDAAQPQFPALAFSSKFTLDSMTGVFTAAVIAQIQGQSTAPLAGQPAATGSNPTSPVGTPTPKPSTTSTGTKAPTATPSTGAALGMKAGWAGVALGALVGVTMF